MSSDKEIHLYRCGDGHEYNGHNPGHVRSLSVLRLSGRGAAAEARR